MKIAKPKRIADLFNEKMPIITPEQILSFKDHKATDDKGRYLHWDEFRRKDAYKADPELAWLATKISRNALMVKVKLSNLSLSYCAPQSLLSLLHYIDKNSGGAVGANNLAGFAQGDKQQFLLKSLIMEEAITSAQLEGAATTRKVAKEMLETERKPKTKDEMMIVNNYRLMQLAIKLKNSPLSIDTILEMHQVATHQAIENNAISGEFRQDNDTCIKDYDGDIIRQPPEYAHLPALMQAFCDFANTQHDGEQAEFIHPVVKAIILHFLIGYIHPFGDGNGRTARALFYWFMLRNGYWLFEYISISKLLKEAPAKYAKAYLYCETDELDLTYFLYYQAEIIKRAIVDLDKYLSDKQKRFREFAAAISNYTNKAAQRLNARQVQILEKAARETGYIFTAKEISNEYGISENTARKDLNTLLKLNLLGQFKAGQTLGYISPNDLIERLKS